MRRYGPFLGLFCVLALACLIYLPSLGGGFHYDDLANIKGLGETDTPDGRLKFLFSGEAGPLGRPLALITFLLQRGSWPDHPADFLLLNLSIHLLNGVLLFWLLRQLPSPGNDRGRNSDGVALAVTLCWLIHPLLLSTNLLVIQRMTSLSATFVLLGLDLFLWGRWRLVEGRGRGYLIMSLGIGLGTVLAVLSKETGILLPLYALVLESVLLRGVVVPDRRFALWRGFFLIVPQLLVLAYLILRFPSVMGGYAIRPFDMQERLLTEVRILGDYLSLIFVPVPAGLGGMHDDYPIVRGLTPGLAALIAVGAVALLAAFRFSRRWPIPAFAVLWFFAGHILESTIFPLELYFEHRNYLPAIGPLLALCYLALGVPRTQRVALALRLGFGLYVVLVASVALSTTRLWGNPPLAGRVWVEDHPQSARAVQFLAQSQLRGGEVEAALATLRSGARRIEQDSALAMQSLVVGCRTESRLDPGVPMEELLQRLPRTYYSSASLSALMDLVALFESGECPQLQSKEIKVVAESLLKNPRYATYPKALHWLHHALARIGLRERDFGTSRQHLESAYRAMPDINTGLMLASVLVSGGYSEQALDLLGQMKSPASTGAILGRYWRERIDKLEDAIRHNPPPAPKRGELP